MGWNPRFLMFCYYKNEIPYSADVHEFHSWIMKKWDEWHKQNPDRNSIFHTKEDHYDFDEWLLLKNI